MRLVWVVAATAIAASCGEWTTGLPAVCEDADSDGDGVCDALDTCPNVPDPGQVDLDGDGVGWACDALETTTIASITSAPDVHAGFDAATFAISLQTNRTVVLGVSPAGLVRAESDSGRAPDAWLVGTTVQGPYVSRDGTIVISTHDGANRSAGTLDPATQLYTVYAAASISEPSDDERPLTYVVLETDTGFQIGTAEGMRLQVISGTGTTGSGSRLGLSDAGATLVAVGRGGGMVDWRTRTVVGWWGLDDIGRYACLASDPGRCWDIPGEAAYLNVFPPDAAAGGDGMFALATVETHDDEATVRVVRPLGAGDRPQPIP